MKKNKKILFICPYPIGVQAGQRFKYEQHFNYFTDKDPLKRKEAAKSCESEGEER